MAVRDLWLVLIGMAVITYGQRLGSMLLSQRMGISEKFSQGLSFVAPSLLSAIIAVELVHPGEGFTLTSVDLPRLGAAFLAVLVAWKTKKVLPTLVIGMVAMWTMQAIIR